MGERRLLTFICHRCIGSTARELRASGSFVFAPARARGRRRNENRGEALSASPRHGVWSLGRIALQGRNQPHFAAGRLKHGLASQVFEPDANRLVSSV